MNISPFEIYLILQADTFRTLFAVSAGVACGLAGVYGLVAGMAGLEEEGTAAYWSRYRRCLAVLILASVSFWLLAAAAPSTDTLVAMFGLPAAIDAVAALDGAEQIPQNTVDALNRLLESVGKE